MYFARDVFQKYPFKDQQRTVKVTDELLLFVLDVHPGNSP